MEQTGWAQRLRRNSKAWHYFVNGTSICALNHIDPHPPFTEQVSSGTSCPDCVSLRIHQRDQPTETGENLREQPIGLGSIVMRRLKHGAVRPCVVTGYFPRRDNRQYYVLTPIPVGMSADDLHHKFWPSIVDEGA